MVLDDWLVEDAVWGEPLSSFPDFPDGLRARDYLDLCDFCDTVRARDRQLIERCSRIIPKSTLGLLAPIVFSRKAAEFPEAPNARARAAEIGPTFQP